MNGGYDLHVQTGRYIQSQYELGIAHYLHDRRIPFCSGIDPKCSIGDGSGRSDDFVVPRVSGVWDKEYRIEVAGLANYHPRSTIDYNASKQEVHEFFSSDKQVDHRIIPPPVNGSKYTETELEELLGDIPKGSSELVEAHDLEYPVKRPGSTYHTLEEMIEDVRSKFSAGSEISVEMVQDAFSDSFWMKLSKYLPGQTITKLANLTGTVTCSAPYNETKEQFLQRVQTLVDEQYSGALPSSYVLNGSVPWLTVQYQRHFDSWGEMLNALGLPPNRVTNSITEDKIKHRLKKVAKVLDKEIPSTYDLQFSKVLDNSLLKEARSAYQWIRSHAAHAGHATAKEYLAALCGGGDQ